MQIKDVMTTDVASTEPQDTVEAAAKIMQQYNVGSVPVCEGKKLVGIVTDRDIAVRCVAQGKDCRQTVGDVMTRDPVTARPSMDVREAALLMSKSQIRRLPIVDSSNLIGMVALGDIAVEPQSSDHAGDALQSISEPARPNQHAR